MPEQDQDSATDIRQMFCVPKDVVSAEQLRTLSVRVYAEENFGKPCFMIAAAGLRKLTQAGYQKIKEEAGPYDGLVLVEMRAPAAGPGTGAPAAGTATAVPATPATPPAPPALKAVNRLWMTSPIKPDFQQKVLDLARDILCPAVNKNVHIWVPHNDVVPPRLPPRDEGAFHVAIYSSGSPSNGNDMRFPGKMWGIQVDCMDRANFAPWDGGVPIMTPEGFECGSIDQFNLFIYHDAVERGSENELAILRKIFEAAAISLKNGCQIPVETRRAAYVELCSKRWDSIKKNAREEHAKLKDSVGRLQRDMIDQIRRLQDAERVMNAHDRAEDYRASYAKEFDRLLGMKQIEDVLFRGNSFIAQTKDLVAIDNRTKLRHHLGKFTITINTETGDVRMMNKTRQVEAHGGKCQAPHVFSNGNSCFGTIQSTVAQMVATQEFSALIQLLIGFLGTANTADPAGWFVHKWPAVKPDGSIETAEETAARVKEFEGKTRRDGASPAPAAEDRDDDDHDDHDDHDDNEEDEA